MDTLGCPSALGCCTQAPAALASSSSDPPLLGNLSGVFFFFSGHPTGDMVKSFQFLIWGCPKPLVRRQRLGRNPSSGEFLPSFHFRQFFSMNRAFLFQSSVFYLTEIAEEVVS